MQEYAGLWNDTPATREGTSELDMVILFRLAEDETRAGRIKIVKGEAVESGPPKDGEKPDYTMTAKAEDWQRLGSGDLDPTRALLGRKVKFRGPLMVAMNHLPALEESMRMFGRIDTDWSV
jgi:putative sterol carrier protein